MKRRGIAVLVLSICVVAIAAFGLWSASDQILSADAGSTTKWVTGSTPESEARAAEEAQGSDDIVTMLMDRQKKNEDIAKKTDQKDTSKKSNDSENKDSYNKSNDNKKNDSETIIEETKEDQKDPEKPFDQEHEELMDQVEYSAETLMLKFKKPFDGEVDSELKRAGVAKLDVMFEMEDHIWYTAYLKKTADVDKTLENVREIKKVAVAEYNFKYETTAAESFDAAVECNPGSGEQHHHKMCGIKDAWKKADKDKGVGGGSSNVVVAVIDTGVDYNHEDLKANMWYNSKETPNNNIDDDGNGYVDDYYGVDMTADDGTSGAQKYNGSGMDDNGHGTHVAGIIAASNNKTGVVGIAYNTKIMAIKAGDASGYFQASNIAEAILYAYDHGADVINMSFGGSASTIAVQDALATAYSRCTLVASSGNGGAPDEGLFAKPSYPAAFSYVLGVMSVDQNNVESSFTNYDVQLYSSVEYEVYAPGGQIYSTIPGNRYAKMSGTSMAAPVVSAQAAILRSYYGDTNTYPTKFIYGQIVGTAEDKVECINPTGHGNHNIPGVVNFYNSITELPTPDIGMSDYTLFDTEKFDADIEGITKGKIDKNNGDGIVDAGETIALGFTLKNRWGMSEDTIVSIDADSEAGIANPYVTFLNNNISYGSIGTYSETDSGKVYSEDGEMWNGWENPFYIKIADNCPNNYSVTLNLTITYKNGLDESDKTTYTDTASILLTVRRGVEVPNIIDEDMTLTKDNYYIIPNVTTVMEGATLRIEAGAQVQFWCSDPQDSYAETGIAELQVKGKLICDGTEEEPIELFPSEWMDKYAVKIFTEQNAYSLLKYTNIVNPFITINKAVNCEFTQNYKDYLKYRSFSSGTIRTTNGRPSIDVDTANDCAFYKLGGTGNATCNVYGDKFYRCIFVDSNIEWYSNAIMSNCIFYGNNNYWDSDNEGGTSSYKVKEIYNNLKLEETYTNKVNGKTYLRVVYTGGDLAPYETNSYLDNTDRFAKSLGGELLSINDKEELEDAKEIAKAGDISYGYKYDVEENKYYNYDETEIPVGIDVVWNDNYENPLNMFLTDEGLRLEELGNGNMKEGSRYHTYAMEIPGEVFISDIKLDEYVVNLDMDDTHKNTYQIEATVTPASAESTKLVYESLDENVVTVDKNGLITPVGQGSTDIYVYAPDRAVYNYITVNVKEEVIPTAIKTQIDEMTIAVGDSKRIGVNFTPTDTTKRALLYESSDTNVATVDERGVVTAKTSGKVTITITGYDDITATVKVNCDVLAEAVTFKNDVYVTTMDKEDGAGFYPVITPANTTQTKIKWSSSNPEVCYVDENGKLIKLSAGTSVLKASLMGSDLEATIKIAVAERLGEGNITKLISGTRYTGHTNDAIVMFEDGSLWTWGGNYRFPAQINISNVKDVMASYNKMYVLDESGTVREYDINSHEYVSAVPNDKYQLKNIYSLSQSSDMCGSFFAISNDGTVWAWGANSDGQLGIGNNMIGTNTTVGFYNAVQVEISEPVKKVVSINAGFTAFLTEAGDVYLAGSGPMNVSTNNVPEKKYSNALDINAGKGGVIIETQDEYICWSDQSNVENKKINKSEEEAVASYHIHYINNGQVYIKDVKLNGTYSSEYKFGDEFVRIDGINDAKKVFDFIGNLYIATENGELYALGYGDNYALGTGSLDNADTPQKIPFGICENKEDLLMQSWNVEIDELANNILKERDIVLDYNQAIKSSNAYSSIKIVDSTGVMISLNKSIDLDKLAISPKKSLTIGETYTLTIPANALKGEAEITNEVLTLTFIYEGPEDHIDIKITHDTVIDDEKMFARNKWTEATITEEWEKFVDGGHNTRFYSNVILNRLNDDDTTTWLRITAPDSSDYTTIGLGGNYWGSTNKELINKQILDFDDFSTLANIKEGEILTEVPSNTYPFVVDAYLEVNGEETNTVGNDLVTFVVDFNRAMDTSIDLSVQFGSAYPYADYTVEGEWATDKQWRGTMQLTTIIENGYQYWSVSNGKAAGTSLKLYKDWGRFPFMIDTSAAQSLLMDGEATETGINLTWQQDDFETLAGYNVYRSEEEDGQYKKLNKTVIPADIKEWFDDTVIPGKKYYYNFTVVQTDLTESEPSGKVIVTAMDTMAPGIYHDPVFHAFTGSNLIVSAVVTDNVKIDKATLYYRTKGTEEWKSKSMTNNNDKYSAVISASEITVDGIEYYIEATDGISTTNKGTADEPIEITVQVAVATAEKGDVDGNGAVELKDAMMVLMAINDRYNMTEEEFARADLDDSSVLEAKEALRILQYVNGSIGSIL